MSNNELKKQIQYILSNHNKDLRMLLEDAKCDNELIYLRTTRYYLHLVDDLDISLDSKNLVIELLNCDNRYYVSKIY